jgi:hypothetical protein
MAIRTSGPTGRGTTSSLTMMRMPRSGDGWTSGGREQIEALGGHSDGGHDSSADGVEEPIMIGRQSAGH